MTKATPIPARSRQIVTERAGGRCELCGRVSDELELHHRQFRSRGGSHEPWNLLALCGWGNHTGCHGWAHTSPHAAAWGVSVASWADPLTQRIWVAHRAAWGRMTTKGELLPA